MHVLVMWVHSRHIVQYRSVLMKKFVSSVRSGFTDIPYCGERKIREPFVKKSASGI
jgi:hypothetical protein